MQRRRRYRRQHYQQRRRVPCSSQKQQQQQPKHQEQQPEQAQQHSRCIRFRSTISNRQTPSLGGCTESTVNDVAAKAASSLPRNDLEHFEVVCRINYGDFRKVQVQFIAADEKICAFAWKRKRRMQLRQQHKHHHHHCSTSSTSASDVHSDDDAVADVGVDAKDISSVNDGARECQERLTESVESSASVEKDDDLHNEKLEKVVGDTPASISVVGDSDDEVFWPKQGEGDGDHNHLTTAPAQQPQSISSTTITATTTNNKNGIVPVSNNSSNSSSKPQTPTTENHEHTHGSQHHLHNNKNKQNNNVTTTRSTSQTPSPILSQQHGRKINSTITTSHAANASTTATTLEKKNASKLQSSSRKLLQKQQCSSEDVVTQDSPSAVELQQTTKALKHQQTGIEAMGVLLQYLVFDLDAFACPAVKLERTKTKENLTKTMRLLDEAKSVCNELQYQLCDKELYYAQREEELQALHRCELEKAQLNLSEAELRASEQISALKTEIRVMDIEQKRSLDCYRLEMDNKLTQNQKHLLAAEQREKDLIERVAALEANEQNLNMQLKAAEESSSQRLQASKLRESELLEKIRVLNLELDMLRETKDSSERELKDKLNLSQDEISVLRISSRRSLNNESMERGGSSPRNSSSTSVAAAALEVTRLQSEAESLRCVLELKQKEISKLTKQNEELMRDADERNALQAKISLLESSNEMLQSELEIKSDKEKDFLRQIDDVQKAFNHETVKRTRLSYDNEALQWQLKQRSEQLHIVEAKLQELSSHELQNSQNSSLGSHSFNRSSQNGASLMNFQMEDDVSPPASPIIKAVIEKTDSVSWVLEMDDDTPEAAASKMVKRAGSFRSVERSPSTRRQFSQSACATTTMNGSSTCNGGAGGPNPLSQSMSAASVIRQHSNGTADFLGRANSRIRSKSVSVKSPEPAAVVAVASTKNNSKNLLRQSSTGNTRKLELMPGAWKEPISSSSPYAGVRPRSSTMKCGAEQDETFFRRSSRKLITCDTSALNTGERLELRGLPTHPSVHDLKAHKKSQQIQESAGEAMVSGTNSEDEGCSHSSDEVVSSSTTSTSSAASATSGSSLSLNNIKNHHHMSLEEEVLLLDKINSLNGTPMEVSWSDDADPFTTNAGSTV